MEWERIVTAAVVIGITLFAARLIDRRMARRDLAPEAVTRYRVLRRSVTAAIVAIGILSALLVIPQVRAVAGAILASGAVIGLVVGFAAQRTLGNFIAGLLIAFTQPVRIGDVVEFDNEEGVVEEIALTYTFIRTGDDVRLVVPNEKLASDTIKNASIVSREKLAQVTLNVPLDKDLSAAVDALRPLIEEAPRGAVLVSDLGPEKAVVTVRASAENPDEVERLESDLRLQAHERLRAAGSSGEPARPPAPSSQGRDRCAELRLQRRRRQRQTKKHRGRKVALLFILLILLLAIAGGVASLGGASEINKRCDLDNLRPVAIGQNTFVYAADGSFLGTIPAEKNRTPVPLDTVSPYMREGILAIEDRRFYEHGGIDVAGILRAAWADIRAGKVVQGGSTITQQLVRNLYIGKEVTLERKVTEACLAIKLNSRWTKDKILEEYLNQVYFGNHAYGVEAAAQTYFSRRART